MAQALIVTTAYTHTLKYAVSRPRPDGSNRLSFPSGHTSNAFSWATIANHHYGSRVGIPAYLVAGFVGASRLERGAHHLSDVLAGAALGYLVARTVLRQNAQPVDRPRGGRKLRFVPSVDAAGRGAGVAVSLEF